MTSPAGCKTGQAGCKTGPASCKTGPAGCKTGPAGCNTGPASSRIGPLGFWVFQTWSGLWGQDLIWGLLGQGIGTWTWA